MSYCFDPQESDFVSKKGLELGYTVMVFACACAGRTLERMLCCTGKRTDKIIVSNALRCVSCVALPGVALHRGALRCAALGCVVCCVVLRVA